MPLSILATQEMGPLLLGELAVAAGIVGTFLFNQTAARARAERELSRRELELLRQELRRAEQRQATLVDRSTEGILVVWPEDLRLVTANPSAKRLLGVNDGPLPRLPEVCQIAREPNEAMPTTPREWLAFIQRRRRIILERQDGGTIEAEAEIVWTEHLERPAWQLFLREVSDYAKIEQQLRQTQKLSTLGEMVCSIAHELCNPLAVVNGYVELLLERGDLDGAVKTQLEKMRSESNRASKLVKNFLAYAHQRPARREAVNLNDVVQRALDVRALELRDECAETILRLDADLPKTIADFDQIQQIVVNLIHNALQAIGKTRAPRLRFTTYALDESVVLKVEDNGPGIPRELVVKIFEPFFTTKPVGVGTGLGLSIAHRIMADHKGRIYYATPADGGAAFVLEFPRADEVESAKAPEAFPRPEVATAGLTARSRVLILDDQEAIADLLGEMVRLSGCEVRVESDPKRALERIEEEDFHVVLSDFRMPEMNGREFHDAAVASKPELARRMIFLTGDLLSEETQRFLESTGAPYLTKPFQLAKVQEAINDVLRVSDLAS